MGIYLEISYDNFDGPSDYFDPFHSVGVDMLLGIVSSQAQTQALFRSVVDRYPELANLAWEWKTENYSMGRGNYLVSPFFSLMDDKGEVIRVRYSPRTARIRKDVRL